ncbi:YlxR domain-containing protein, partial [Dysosmobacter welbionis]
GPRSLMCGFVRRDDRGWNRPVAPGTHWTSSSDDGVGGWSCGAGNTAVFVCPSCGAELSGKDFRSSRWSPDGTDALPQLWSDASRRGMPQKRAVK